jgi:hypothetical protein
MRVLVIGNCSGRKRFSAGNPVNARDLIAATPTELVRSWLDILARQTTRLPAAELYCGRGFAETLAAARFLKAELLIASAGLGLVHSSTPVPTYNATVSGNSDDNVLRILPGSDAAVWWRVLNDSSPYARRLSTEGYELVLVALSGPYLKMVVPELEQLPLAERRKIRFFSGTPSDQLPVALRELHMPYDARFDHDNGPLPGTKSDFAQRALRHFATSVLCRTGGVLDIDTHRESVERELRLLSAPVRPSREKLGDQAVSELIRQNWLVAEGKSTKMLRHLRDTLGVACEQKRFQNLFSQVKAAIMGGTS